MSNPSKIVLITGATAGIGRMTALHLAKRGHHVIATGRKPAELAKLRDEARAFASVGDANDAKPGDATKAGPVTKLGDATKPGDVKLYGTLFDAATPAAPRDAEAGQGRLDTLLLDVTSLASITAAALEVDRLTQGRGLDVLVNNAGFGVLGPTSEISDSEMRRQYETNVFGLMNVTRAFLPKMMERRAGRIINVSSVGGRITLPYFGVYNSTKYAVESLSDAMRYELRPFGIDVSMIEPGVIRTNFEATAVASIQALANGPYKVAVEKYESMSKSADRFASNPIVIAKAIARAVEARRPAARYVAPFSTNFVILFARLFPTRMWDWAMRKVGFLNAKSLGLSSPTPAAVAPLDMTPSSKPTESPRAAAN